MVSATHPPCPVDQVIEFGDDVFALAGGDVGFFLDDGRALLLDLERAEDKQHSSVSLQLFSVTAGYNHEP